MKSRKKLLVVLYTLSLVAICWHPFNTIRKIEFPSEKTVEMKFRVRLYDPYDPMRGRYVRLQVFPDRLETRDKKSQFHWRKSRVFAVLQKGPDGFAKVLRLESDLKNIKSGEFFVKVSPVWYNSGHGKEKGKNFYRFSLPFKQYYVNEFKAPQLEEELRKRSAENQNMVLTVRFFKEGLYAVSGLDYPSKAVPEKN